jgi:serine/threonine-protein kinase
MGRHDMVGSVVSGRYRIVSLIGSGGMAEVYLAEHVHMRKAMAIKLLRRGSDRFAELTKQFEREAIAGAHIDHPNVASATDFGFMADGSCFLALEFVEGVTLSSLLKRGPLAPSRARRITRQLADAVAACHALGVIHRDIKPGNIMVDESRGDRVKLIDFGLARVPVERVSNRTNLAPGGEASGDDEPTRRIELPIGGPNVVFGTVTYMPPEIALGMDAIDERSDLYALGMVLYEMLAGRVPFEIRDPAQLLVDKRSAPPPIRHRAPGVEAPPELERIAHRLLAPSPTHRFQSARALMAALEHEAPGDSMWLRASSTLRLIPAVVATRDLVGRSRRLGLPILAVAAGVGLAFAIMHHNTSGEQQPLAASTGLADAALEVSVSVSADHDAEEQKPPVLVDASRLRTRFIRLHRRGKVGPATQALMDIVEAAPDVLAHREARRRAGALAILLDHGEKGAGTALFAALRDAGQPGWDVLYEVLSAHGGTQAADRATEILAAPDLRKAMSPSLRIALELRETRCKDKPDLFERAGDEGDMRARIYLAQLRSSRCQPQRGECCYHHHRGLGKALRKLRAKAD